MANITTYDPTVRRFHLISNSRSDVTAKAKYSSSTSPEALLMTDLPPLLRDQRKADAQHLSLLAIFHFVVAGLAIVGIAFVFVHYLFMNTLFTNPKLWAGQKNGGPPPQEFFMIFKWFYVIFGLLLASCSLGNLISGIFIRARKHRLFSLIVAGLNCIHMPFGTVLGVFTLVVLLRDSVRELYEVEKDELKSIAASPT